jgi:hypothetical protein
MAKKMTKTQARNGLGRMFSKSIELFRDGYISMKDMQALERILAKNQKKLL